MWTSRRDAGARSVEPARRIGQDRLEGDSLCRAEQWGVDAEGRRHDLDERPRGRERLVVEPLLDGRRDERVQTGEPPAEHNPGGVEHVDEAGEPDPQPPTDLADGGQCRVVAGGSVGEDRLDCGTAAVRRPSSAHQQRLLADLRLPTSDRSASAAAARQRVDGGVPDLATVAGNTGQRTTTD